MNAEKALKRALSEVSRLLACVKGKCQCGKQGAKRAAKECHSDTAAAAVHNTRLYLVDTAEVDG